MAVVAAGNAGDVFFGDIDMTGKTPDTLQLILADDDGRGRITVDMDAFLEFSFDLTEDLQDMVDQWSHATAPQALRERRDIQSL